ncbi:unnamed protein product, partial [Citrullus colocynthis]
VFLPPPPSPSRIAIPIFSLQLASDTATPLCLIAVAGLRIPTLFSAFYPRIIECASDCVSTEDFHLDQLLVF